MAHAASVSGSCPLAGRSRGRRCLKTAHERGTAFLISANVTNFQRSVKSPNRGTWPITPSNVLLCLFQHLHRLFLGRQSLQVPGTLCHTRLLGPPYMRRVKASDHPKQQCPVAENTAGLHSQTRHPPLGQILPSPVSHTHSLRRPGHLHSQAWGLGPRATPSVQSTGPAGSQGSWGKWHHLQGTRCSEVCCVSGEGPGSSPQLVLGAVRRGGGWERGSCAGH